MKKIIFGTVIVAALLLLVPSLVYGKVDKIIPNKTIVKREIKLNNFESIEVNGSFDVEYVVDNTCKIKLTGPDNVLPLVEVKVSHNKLVIGYQRNVKFTKSPKIKAVVSAPAVNAFEINGSGEIDLPKSFQVALSEISLQVNGSGNVKAGYVECSKLIAQVNGSGDIEIDELRCIGDSHLQVNGSGNIEVDKVACKKLTASVNGSGDLNCGDVKATRVIADLSGSGDLKCGDIKATHVIASLSGSGDIVISGKTDDAILSVNTSGDLQAYNLVANSVEATVNGSGDLACYAQKKLKAALFGSGDIIYGGQPKVEKIGNKKGDIRHK